MNLQSFQLEHNAKVIKNNREYNYYDSIMLSTYRQSFFQGSWIIPRWLSHLLWNRC